MPDGTTTGRTGSCSESPSVRAVDRKATVQRLVEEAVNGGRYDLIDDLFTPDAGPGCAEWFSAFRRSFPDMEMRA